MKAMRELNPRKPRFTRVSDPPNFSLTPRDLDIIRHVARYRFLRSTHIAALVGASHQVVSRRLQLLFHHGYLDRPKEQFVLSRLYGNQHMVYGPKGQPAKSLFVEHTLTVADLMVSLECACRTRAGIRFIDQDEILPERNAGNPLYWSLSIILNGRRHHFGVVPDRLFGIEVTDGSGHVRRGYFFLEADRGTMPLVRHMWHQTSITRKLLAYVETWKQRLHEKRFGIPRFRVIITTGSAERAKRIATLCKKLSHGSGLFLVASIPKTDGTTSLLNTVFQTASGESAHLTDGI
jgi:hypothetical protein